MDGATAGTGTSVAVAVEGLEERRQIAHDAGQLNFDAMHAVATAEAVPLESVPLAFRPLRLDHQAHRAGYRPLGRMPDMRRQQEDIALADRHVVMPAAVDDLQDHVAFELIEEFLRRIVMEVRPLVGSADDRHHQPGIGPDLLVPDGRPQQMAMRLDPGPEVERRKLGHGTFSLTGFRTRAGRFRLDQAADDAPHLDAGNVGLDIDEPRLAAFGEAGLLLGQERLVLHEGGGDLLEQAVGRARVVLAVAVRSRPEVMAASFRLRGDAVEYP